MVQRGTRCMVACGRVLGDSVWSGCTPFGCMWTGAGGQYVEWVSPLWVPVDGVLRGGVWSGSAFGCLWTGCWGSVCGSGCLLWMSVDKLSPENFGVFHYVEATCFS